MARLDPLISFMDRLEAKSSRLLQTANSTSSLLQHVSRLHSSIALADSTIGSLNETIASNYTYLHKIDQLHEKSFYLESSLSSNDTITNQNTWNNLYDEYQYIVDQFKESTNESRVTSVTLDDNRKRAKTISKTQPEPQHDGSAQTSVRERQLTNSISVSDIRLKPIKCREKKMYKKKSKYRLSQIYNINPLLNSPILEHPVSDAEFNSSAAEIAPETQAEEEGTEATEANQSTSTEVGYKEALTLCTSPEILFPPLSSSKLRARSNSVPEISFLTANGEYTGNGHHIFNAENITRQSHMLNEFSESDEALRRNRLKHFVSMGSGLHKSAFKLPLPKQLQQPLHTAHEVDQESSPFNINFNKTPVFTPICLEDNDLDQLDIDACSDYSYYSPEKLEEDDFEKYLRRSRVDMNDPFPNAIKRSKSHDSVFSSQLKAPKWVFHNPIDNIASTQVAGPTIKISDDYIYYRGNEGSDRKEPSDKTADLLNEVILRNTDSQAEDDTPSTPSKSTNFLLFSPFKTASTSSILAGPALSKSFTESLMNFVNSDKKKATPSLSTTGTTVPSLSVTPQPSPQLKDLSTTKPIMINNSSQLKRVPPQRRETERTDGSHSKMTIGPNRTTIFNHGQQSYFKRPLQSKVSHNSLHEALSFNMLQ